MLRRGLGHGHPGAGPQGPRPALQPGRQRTAGHGIRPPDPVPPGPAGDGALVCPPPGLVGAVEAVRSPGRPGSWRPGPRGLRPGGSGRLRARLMTRWLVTGAAGLLRTDLGAALERRGHSVTG